MRETQPDEAAALLGLVFLMIAITISVQASWASWLAGRLGVRPMGVLIIGAGRVGRMLAQRLVAVNEEVTVVEIDPEKAELARRIGANVVVGDGTTPAVLEKADVRSARTVVATTRSDKDNLLACQIARTKYDREHLVSRVSDPDSLPSFEVLGIRVMNPAAATAMILSNLVRRPDIFSLLSTGEDPGDADVTEVLVTNDDVAGKTLRDLKLPGDSLVVMIRRGGRRLVPHGDSQIQIGDVLTIAGTGSSTRDAEVMLTRGMRVSW
jgi:Trk K+ transport system NAD-binding subunit